MAVGCKVISKLEQIATIMQFQHVESSRSRFAETCGNIAQLLMQLCDQVGYIERRSMELMAHTPAFHRQIREKICGEIWRNPTAARARFGRMCQQFLAQKLANGAKINENDFLAQITDVVREESDKQLRCVEDQRKVNNGKVLQDMIKSVKEIAEEYKWFPENLRWEV